MIYDRLRGYSHLPHQVANNGISCYDANGSFHAYIIDDNDINDETDILYKEIS